MSSLNAFTLIALGALVSSSAFAQAKPLGGDIGDGGVKDICDQLQEKEWHPEWTKYSNIKKITICRMVGDPDVVGCLQTAQKHGSEGEFVSFRFKSLKSPEKDYQRFYSNGAEFYPSNDATKIKSSKRGVSARSTMHFDTWHETTGPGDYTGNRRDEIKYDSRAKTLSFKTSEAGASCNLFLLFKSYTPTSEVHFECD